MSVEGEPAEVDPFGQTGPSAESGDARGDRVDPRGSTNVDLRAGAMHGPSPLAASGIDEAAAHAVVRRKLFGSATQAPRIGRFSILSVLGSGGMGTVLAAYDEHLDRKVAVKLLRADVDEASRRRVIREARAMARLAHPNVVQVFEAGEHDDQPFIAMEYIEGRDLQAWADGEDVGWKDALDAYVQAGQGLAAAHAAGIVHRDFKPANAIIDSGGRVRVLDFGLATTALAAETTTDATLTTSDGVRSGDATLTSTGTVLGTPAFMPPEQIRGGRTDHLADQFSFCVALWGVLYGRRPFGGETRASLFDNVLEGRISPPSDRPEVPAWIEPILRRGLQTDPQQRWPDMRALLDELTRDRDRGRRGLRRGLWLGGTVAVTVAGTWVIASGGGPACDGVALELDDVWGPSQREELRKGFQATGAGYASTTAAKVDALLTAYATAWIEARTRACESASAERNMPPELALQQLRCLDMRKHALSAYVELYAQPDGEALERATLAAAELPNIDSCSDVGYLAAEVPPPDDPAVAQRVDEIRQALARVEAVASAGRYQEATRLAADAAEQARATAYTPVIVEALDRLAEVRLSAGELDASRSPAQEAYELSDDASRTEAVRNLRLLTKLARGAAEYDHAALTSARAQALVVRALGPEHPDVADTLYVAGTLHRSRGDPATALQTFRRALQIEERARGAEHPSVAGTHSAIGNALYDLGRYDEAREAYEHALQITTAAYGGDHPSVALAINNIAVVLSTLGDDEGAVEALQDSLAIKEHALSPDHPDVALAHHNLGAMFGKMGKLDDALAHLRRALAIREAQLGPEHPEVASVTNAIGNVLHSKEDYEGARQSFERALELAKPKLGADHPDLAYSHHGLGLALQRLGELDRAAQQYRRAIELVESGLGRDNPRQISARNNLANILHTQGDLAGAAAQHERALEVGVVAFGPDHANVAQSRYNLGRVYHDAGDPARGVEQLVPSLVVRQKVLSPNDPRVAHTAAALAIAALAAGRLSEVETARRVVVDVAAAHPENTSFQALARAIDAAVDNTPGSRRVVEQARAELGAGTPDLKLILDRWLQTHR